MFGTSTVSAVFSGLVGDIATIIGASIVVILGLYAALTGLGWAVRKFRHYVSGRKF
jgi:putative Mn2+ efflux pump MntP